MTRAVLALGSAVALVVWWLRRRYAVVSVGGHSMAPTYAGGERVLVRRAPPTAIARGQVVVVEVPRLGQDPLWPKAPHGRGVGGRAWMIKRAVALPGDPAPAAFATALGASAGQPVPAGRLLVAGDNAEVSYDSRAFGYVPFERVLGVALRTLGEA